jgi:multiple sugar transport system substrate-binding protein
MKNSMSNAAYDLLDRYRIGDLSRRDLMRRMSKLGFGVAASAFMLNEANTMALAETGFDWKKYSGSHVSLLLNKHPYVMALIANLPNFKKLTGIEVSYELFPEDTYFDKVNAALDGRGGRYDVFMTGAYQAWGYGSASQIVDLNEYLHDPIMTAPTYDFQDILSNLRASVAWSGVNGESLDGPGAKQLALPWGFELNSLSYNTRLLRQAGMEPPRNLPDLMDKAARISAAGNGIYGVGVRGSRSWATIHAGYISALTNYGGVDFTITDGKLQAAMNSRAAKDFTRLWVKMIQEGGSPNWRNATWYEVGADLGAGTSAMIYDADNLGFFSNRETNEAGNIGFYPLVPNPAAVVATPNIWVWSLAMNNFWKRNPAAWNFMQWATGTENTTFGATKADLVNPVRKSIWNNKEFSAKMDKTDPGYLQQYRKIVDQAKIYLTPQTQFLETGTQWAGSLQKMVAGKIDVAEGLDQLAVTIERKLQDAG